MPATAALPGMFFCFAAVVMLVFTSVSAPVWTRIYFLEGSLGATSLKYGIWGYCTDGACSGSMLGYDINAGQTMLSNHSGVLHNLTYVLILNPIAGAFALLAMFMGVIGVAASSRFATILMSIASCLAAIICAVAWAVEMVLFSIIKNDIKNAGGSSMYGNALWITLGAFVSLLIAMFCSLFGSCGRFRSKRDDTY